ncbi:MAG: aminopeptidase P family protein [Thalassobaculales bacterium]
MSACREIYQGDEVLDALLKKHGSALDSTALRRLAAGIAASPLAEDDESWFALVTAQPSAALKAQLSALRRTIATPAPVLDAATRLARLREALGRAGLDGFVVPHADEHLNEYLPARAERLSWLTGFTGSAGAAVVLPGKAAVFADGRYTLQVAMQVDASLYQICHLIEHPPARWIEENAAEGQRIGYDPWLHTREGVERLAKAAARAGAKLVAVESNPLDAVWPGQPPAPLAPVIPHPVDLAGRDSADKRAEAAAALAKAKQDAVVLSAPDSIAWLLNVRGGDVPHTPLPLSFAILTADGSVDWFVDPLKLLPETRAHVGNAVAIHPPEALAGALDALRGRKVRLDPATAPAWLDDRLTRAGATVVAEADPCQLPKACKNAAEIAGSRAAHKRDGAAVTRFLAWLSQAAAEGAVDEITAADRLEGFRRDTGELRDLSFSTISGAGPNGAIVHYRSTPETNRRLEPGQVYLVDSGAQYRDGTTDVTRTLAIGTPDPAIAAELRDRFTRVLKGHIAIATARFPEGTSGSQLDILARRPLWQAGLDFDHGTGHGVGSYLSVHEGPHRISKVPNTVALKPGMIVSNEPGYYKTGAYGIRIENLVTVVPVEAPPGAERKLLGFETLTLAPIDRSLIEPALLDDEERAWLNAYHARVLAEIGPGLDAATRAWLADATRPI